jgi:general secretion pathway protein G
MTMLQVHPQRTGSKVRPRSGFTLIEMVVVVAIVGILAAAAQPLLALQSQRRKELELRHSLRVLRSAIDAYKQAVTEGKVAPVEKDNDSGYPPNLQVLVDGVDVAAPAKTASGQTDANDPPKRIYFLRRMPRDPFSSAASGEVAASQTWGLRSYASPANAPQAGSDVFDVYSRAEGTGLDGTAYRSW